MALVSRVGTYRFEHDGQAILLQLNGENVRKIETYTGMDLSEYVDTCVTQIKLAELFHYCQIPSHESSGEETKEAIYDAFFYDMILFMDPDFQHKIQEALAALIGKEMLKLFKEGRGDSKKK